MPVHPEPRNTHTAPQQPVKQILQEFNKIVQHHTLVQQHMYNQKIGTQFANT